MSTIKAIKCTGKYTFLIADFLNRFKDPAEARRRLNISWNKLSEAEVSHLERQDGRK